MIQFLMTGGHAYTIATLARDPGAPALRVLTYDAIFRARRLPQATYVFTDFDRLSISDLTLAARLYRQLKALGLRVFNDPARARKRFSLLRALYEAGLNSFNVHRVEELPSSIRFPVFVRTMHGHGLPCTGLLDGRDDLERAIDQEIAAGAPREGLMVIEYVGEPVSPGVYRKLSTFRMGNNMLPYTCVHQSDWLVKQGTMGVAGEALYEDELRIVRENPYAEQLRRAFEIAEIDYGRADFGFYKGKLQVFEINTNPHIQGSRGHAFATRLESMELVWKRLLEGIRGMDSPAGPDVLLPKDPSLSPHRRWQGWFIRSREVN